MNRENPLYSRERAEDEASAIKEKIKSGKAKDYNVAEKMVEDDYVKENLTSVEHLENEPHLMIQNDGNRFYGVSFKGDRLDMSVSDVSLVAKMFLPLVAKKLDVSSSAIKIIPVDDRKGYKSGVKYIVEDSFHRDYGTEGEYLDKRMVASLDAETGKLVFGEENVETGIEDIRSEQERAEDFLNQFTQNTILYKTRSGKMIAGRYNFASGNTYEPAKLIKNSLSYSGEKTTPDYINSAVYQAFLAEIGNLDEEPYEGHSPMSEDVVKEFMELVQKRRNRAGDIAWIIAKNWAKIFSKEEVLQIYRKRNFS